MEDQVVAVSHDESKVVPTPEPLGAERRQSVAFNIVENPLQVRLRLAPPYLSLSRAIVTAWLLIPWSLRSVLPRRRRS